MREVHHTAEDHTEDHAGGPQRGRPARVSLSGPTHSSDTPQSLRPSRDVSAMPGEHGRVFKPG